MAEASGFWMGVMFLGGRAVVSLLIWLVMLYIPLATMNLNPRKALSDITLPEAVFFGLYSIASALAVSSAIPRFI